MVELAEEHAADFVTRAEQHDRENTFVGENFELMKKSGFLAAACARGVRRSGRRVGARHHRRNFTTGARPGSTAIAANMHVGAVWTVTRTWSRCRRRENPSTRASVKFPAVPR